MDSTDAASRPPRDASRTAPLRRDAPVAIGLSTLPADLLRSVADQLTAGDEYTLARASKSLHTALATRTAGLPAIGAAQRAARPTLSRASIAAAVAVADAVEATPWRAVGGLVDTGAVAGATSLALGAGVMSIACAPLTIGGAMWAGWRRTGRWRFPADVEVLGDAWVRAAYRLPEAALQAGWIRSAVAAGRSRAARLGIALANVDDQAVADPHFTVRLRALAGHGPAPVPQPPEVDAALGEALFQALRDDDFPLSLRCLLAGARPDYPCAGHGTLLWAARRLQRPRIRHLLQHVTSATLHWLLGSSPGPLQRRLVREWLAAGGLPLVADSSGHYPRERALARADAELLDVLDEAARAAMSEAVSHDDAELALRVLVAGPPWPAQGPGSLGACYDDAAEGSLVRTIFGAWQRGESDAAISGALDEVCAQYRISTPSHRLDEAWRPPRRAG